MNHSVSRRMCPALTIAVDFLRSSCSRLHRHDFVLGAASDSDMFLVQVRCQHTSGSLFRVLFLIPQQCAVLGATDKSYVNPRDRVLLPKLIIPQLVKENVLILCSLKVGTPCCNSPLLVLVLIKINTVHALILFL
jgi:hypothetical protein